MLVAEGVEALADGAKLGETDRTETDRTEAVEKAAALRRGDEGPVLRGVEGAFARLGEMVGDLVVVFLPVSRPDLEKITADEPGEEVVEAPPRAGIKGVKSRPAGIAGGLGVGRREEPADVSGKLMTRAGGELGATGAIHRDVGEGEGIPGQVEKALEPSFPDDPRRPPAPAAMRPLAEGVDHGEKPEGVGLEGATAWVGRDLAHVMSPRRRRSSRGFPAWAGAHYMPDLPVPPFDTSAALV